MSASERSAWTASDGMSYAEAVALTNNGARPLMLYAKDEAGNVGSGQFDLAFPFTADDARNAISNDHQ